MLKVKQKNPHIVDIEKSLYTTVTEISSDSEDEVTYTKTRPSHLRDRLR